MSKKIIIDYQPKPIPINWFDYSATYDNYEPDDPIGYGATAEDAEKDLLQKHDGDL